ncbi:hypothetical protein [Sorangium sp. So ce1153]|uniref:hypothetical protein n=1 Tax=Sorangium sp. So ce1153 TaxID=3133333 RepID=UPI003F5EE3CB
MPAEAEWHDAAAGGDEQRPYPWSDLASDGKADTSHAVYGCARDGSASGACAFRDRQPVGSRSTKGDGRWEQATWPGTCGRGSWTGTQPTRQSVTIVRV